MRFLTLLFFILVSSVAFSQDTILKDFSSLFDAYGVKGCFSLYSSAEDYYIQYNANYCDSGYIPASTFKIPHALIVLQEEVIRDTNQVIPWGGTIHDYAFWNSDQNLATAIKYSCVWAFSDFTNNVAHETYQRYVNQFNYGNKTITGPPHLFWLAGQFRISANEQIQFLRKFYNYNLGVDSLHIALVKKLIIIEQDEQYTLSAKTGSGRISDTEYVMWMVGYVETKGKPCFFALNFTTTNLKATQSARLSILKSALFELNILK